MISLGSEVSKLRLDGHIRGERRSRWTPPIETEDIFLGSLKILFFKGWMLWEIRTLNDHGSPRVQNLFDVSLAIHGCLILPPSVFKFSPCRVLGDCLQAAKLPHYSCRKICGGSRMTYEWYSVKIKALRAAGPGGIHAARHLKPLGEKDSNWHAGRLDGLLSESSWRMAWRYSMMHGFGTTGTVLHKDGGSRLKGVNSLKSSGDLWGPNRRPNRATYPYSEPLSNLRSYYRSWERPIGT
ncbi:hypothetical protein CRG98_039677 [Punica granatum]|uniref:Uncharacterized protein n=1 Tax=Punica granatum TaxID=22663 RepID=A0A2I0I809_PUNGR|nr:hypothetical protein CRG98_039677 [Punica granatum]